MNNWPRHLYFLFVLGFNHSKFLNNIDGNSLWVEKEIYKHLRANGYQIYKFQNTSVLTNPDDVIHYRI